MDKAIIGFAADHAGFELKENLTEYVAAKGYAVKDFGTYSSERCDYPDVAHALAEAVADKRVSMGISICFTGNGINIAANRHRGVRSTICLCEDMARLARFHNDANICALASKYVDTETARKIVDVFLSKSFEGGRHQARIEKIENF